MSGSIRRRYAVIVATALFVGFASVAQADDSVTARAHYLGNAGVMVEHGATRILFDPLFREDFDDYELVPPEMQRALLAGAAPWDGVDAVFVSHYHDDHYDPALMVAYLKAHPGIRMYAPAQAVERLHAAASPADGGMFERVHGLALAYGDASIRIEMDSLLIEALFVPHSGWPGSNTEVENLAFRVTLDGAATVTHLGDADGDVVHFAGSAEHWEQRRTHLALPPYWFLYGSDKGSLLLQDLNADHATGIHVPKSVSDDPSARPAALQGIDLFTRPGESRDIP
ncbi:MAG: MBL fold metallo-hydrolase [Woeseiaceae bacterium]|nr:MBL fold metallo-hydrolase [Woeseiaceae bacterium]